MKKIYFAASALLMTFVANAQNVTPQSGAYVKRTVSSSVMNTLTGTNRTPTDTTGIGNAAINQDFIPEFNPDGGANVIFGNQGGGYIYGVANSGTAGVFFNKCAQGYQNIIGNPATVEGVLVFFAVKESDAGSSATSKVVIKAWNMAANKAYNTVTPGQLNQTVLNWVGPSTAVTAPVASKDLLFTDIDTGDVNGYNYVEFPAPSPVFAGDFAVGVDASTLAAGDTVGILSDSQNDAAGVDLAYHNVVNKWFVSDMLFSDAGGNGIDNNIAIFAVLGTGVVGVSEYFNGMKLNTYPNPAADLSTIEYSLEKDSKDVSLVVFDLSGRKVVDKKYDQQAAGNYKVELETINMASGTYFYQLRANGKNITKKFAVVK